MKKIGRIFVIIMVMAMTLTLAGCKNGGGQSGPSGGDSGGGSGKTEPEFFGEFETKAMTGETMTEKIFGEAGVTMVNVWATYCGPCVREIPELEKLSKAYDEKEFRIIGIVSDSDTPGDPKAQKLIDKLGVTYTQLMISEDLIKGPLKGIQVVPTTLFVNSEGKILDAVIGAKDYDTWESIVEKVLKKAGVNR